MSRKLNQNRALFVLGAGLVVLAAGCAKEPRSAVGRLDTPEHHTLRGHDFVDEGKWADAEREFDLALSLNKDFGPALAGKGIVTAKKAGARGLMSRP